MYYLILALLLISCGTEVPANDDLLRTQTSIIEHSTKEALPEKETIEEIEATPSPTPEPSVEPTPSPQPDETSIGQIKADLFDAYILEKVADLNTFQDGDLIHTTWIATTTVGSCFFPKSCPAGYFFGPKQGYFYEQDEGVKQPYINAFSLQKWTKDELDENGVNQRFAYQWLTVFIKISEYEQKMAFLKFKYRSKTNAPGLEGTIDVDYKLFTDPQ